ncbi:MAG TPA: NAD(P)-dependent oxidoreductase [Kofleriaceae bacterium]|nr:NAD(P)-dependent oxidoreductase [Kofleriaceae bacterium]
MARRPALALSLAIGGRPALVVGAGPGADERASRLRAAGAAVRQVAPADYRTDMCADVFLVVAQSGNAELDRRVAADAAAAGAALRYAHDQPEVSDFAFPALARRGPLALAVSTDGAAPALARRLREELGRLLEDAGAQLDALVRELEHERAEWAPSPERADRLYRLACRLRLAGRLEIDP